MAWRGQERSWDRRLEGVLKPFFTPSSRILRLTRRRHPEGAFGHHLRRDRPHSSGTAVTTDAFFRINGPVQLKKMI